MSLRYSPVFDGKLLTYIKQAERQTSPNGNRPGAACIFIYLNVATAIKRETLGKNAAAKSTPSPRS
jgi:hypothetical protein